jgi:hypothetical protein
MRNLLLILILLLNKCAYCQIVNNKLPLINIRASFLLVPNITPLLTVETGIRKNITLQLETNFKNTHGANLKYYPKKRMSKDYIFLGNAILKSSYLRSDNKLTLLPYLGYGYAYRFGKLKNGVLDARLGLGHTLNAMNNIILPVIKIGVGRII